MKCTDSCWSKGENTGLNTTTTINDTKFNDPYSEEENKNPSMGKKF